MTLFEFTIDMHGFSNPIDNTSDIPSNNNGVGISDFRLMSAETNWEVICSELNERLNCDMSELDATQQLEYYYHSCLEAVKAGAPMRKKPKNFKRYPH